MKMKYFVAGVFSIIVVLAIAGGAFYLGSKRTLPGPSLSSGGLSQNGSRTPEPQGVSDGNGVSAPAPTSEPTPEPVNGDALRDNVIAAITSKNYAALESYMTDPVQVRIEASGCCGPLTPTETVTQLDYLNQATAPWVFDSTDPAVSSLATGFAEYYGGGAIVGVSASDHAVSIQVNDQNQIFGVSMVVDYHLLLP